MRKKFLMVLLAGIITAGMIAAAPPAQPAVGATMQLYSQDGPARVITFDGKEWRDASFRVMRACHNLPFTNSHSCNDQLPPDCSGVYVANPSHGTYSGKMQNHDTLWCP